MKEVWMDGIWSTRDRSDKYVQYFGLKCWRKRTTRKT